MNTTPIETIHSISQVIANARDASGAAEQAAQILVEQLKAESVKLALWNDADRRLARVELGAEGAGRRVTKRIEVRGVEYGRLELGLSEGAAPAEVVEVVAGLLGGLAELDGLRGKAEGLKNELREQEWRLKNEKVIARATGLVARMRGMEQRAAGVWLKEESGRQGVPVWQLAERVIEGHLLTGRLKSPQLRKTA